MSKFLVCGQKRAKFRRLIQKHLDESGKSQTDIAVLAGVSRQAVSATLLGRLHSPKILNALRLIGVPEKYLFDPHRTNLL